MRRLQSLVGLQGLMHGRFRRSCTSLWMVRKVLPRRTAQMPLFWVALLLSTYGVLYMTVQASHYSAQTPYVGGWVITISPLSLRYCIVPFLLYCTNCYFGHDAGKIRIQTHLFGLYARNDNPHLQLINWLAFTRAHFKVD